MAIFVNSVDIVYIILKYDVLQASLRNFPSARAASLFANETPKSVYDGLIQEANHAFPLLDRYLKLRKQALHKPHR